MITNKKEIGVRLRRIRKSCNLSLEAAATAAGISDRALASIERGDTTMRIDTLLSICSVLSVTPNDILLPPVDYSSAEKLLQQALDLAVKQQ